MITLQTPIEKLLKAHPSMKDIEAADMSRAAVVLAVAAMDAYFTDAFVERLVPFIKQTRPGESLVALLRDAGLDTAMALELLTMNRPYRRVRTLVDGHLERTTTQRLKAIDELFICYGLKNFCQNIQKLKNRQNLLASVEKIVERRHKIVHEGDLNAHRRLNAINPTQTKRRIVDVLTFVSGADELLQRQIAV